MYKICILLIIFTLLHFSWQRTMNNKVICEGHTQRIHCSGDARIVIVGGNYGRLSADICPYYDDPNMQTDCYSDRAVEIMRKLCDKMQSCKLRADNLVFSDPCPGQVKYIDVTYICWPKKKLSLIFGGLPNEYS